MLSRLDMINRAIASTNDFNSQKSDERGNNNLFIGGKADDIVYNDSDETVILTGAGNDFVDSRGNNNLIESESGNNTIISNGNNNEINVANGNNQISSTGNNGKITADNGNNSITVNGNANSVSTDHGNNNIFYTGNYGTVNTDNGDNIIIYSGANGKVTTDNGNNQIAYTGNNGTVETDHGNNTIIYAGTNGKVTTDNGNNQIAYTGNNGTVETDHGNNTIIYTGDKGNVTTDNGNNKIAYTGNNGTVNTDNGNNQIVMIGNYSTVNAGSGIDNILSIGNYANLNAGNGNNSVVFQGDNINITAGNGNNYIASLDFAISDGNYTDYSKYLDGQVITETNKNQLISSEEFQKILSQTSTTTYDSADILNKLSAQEKQLLSQLNMNEKVGNQPKYVIAKGADNQYHIYQYQSATQYKSVQQVAMGSNYLYLTSTSFGQTTTKATTTTTTVTQDMIRETYADFVNTILKGNKNVNVTAENGNNTIKINASGLDITTGNGNNNIIGVDGILIGTEETNYRTQEKAKDSSNTNTTTNTTTTTTTTGTGSVATPDGGYSTGSPLIIDFNQDGKVSAAHGIGVDIDGNGTADGAAADGDKMLAMTDINGNGKIDGNEVFGDKTVNPFTGEALNAANGFEALKMVAEAAQDNTGIQCIKDGIVDLKALDQALQTKGIKLGFISDENNSELEELSKVASINVSDYKTQQETGAIQHNQLGTAIFEDGSINATHDVWFELTGINNPFELVK